MKRFNKNPDTDQGTRPDPESRSDNNALRYPDSECRFELNFMRLMAILLIILMAVSVLFSVSMVLRDLPDDGVWETNEARVFEVKSQKGTAFFKPFRKSFHFGKFGLCMLCVWFYHQLVH